MTPQRDKNKSGRLETRIQGTSSRARVRNQLGKNARKYVIPVVWDTFGEEQVRHTGRLLEIQGSGTSLRKNNLGKQGVEAESPSGFFWIEPARVFQFWVNLASELLSAQGFEAKPQNRCLNVDSEIRKNNSCDRRTTQTETAWSASVSSSPQWVSQREAPWTTNSTGHSTCTTPTEMGQSRGKKPSTSFGFVKSCQMKEFQMFFVHVFVHMFASACVCCGANITKASWSVAT